MSFSSTFIVAAAVAALAAPVLASPAFDAFQQTCGDTQADFAAVKAAVAKGAWVPTEVTPSTMEGVTVIESLARAETLGGVPLTVYAWHGMNGKIAISACTVRATGTDFKAVDAEARAWVGFAPQTVEASKSKFQFTPTATGIRAVEPAGQNAAAAGSGLELFTVSADGADTILDLLKIKS